MKLGSAGDMSGQSFKGVSQGSAQHSQYANDGHYMATSSWQGKQLPQMTSVGGPSTLMQAVAPIIS